jgi:polysaccharide pyruvyl transferase WcaK-like protein
MISTLLPLILPSLYLFMKKKLASNHSKSAHTQSNDLYATLSTFSLSDYIKSKKLSCKKFLIFGNFGAYNLGDEAILAGQIEDLKKNKKSEITVISRYPDVVKKLHNVDSVSLFSLVSVIKGIASSDAVITGGGGLFCKNDRGIRGILFQLYTLGLFMLLPHLFRKKVIVWGIGIYSDMEKIIAFWCKILLQRALVVTVRDHASYKVTQAMQIDAQLAKDNSYLMRLKDAKSFIRDPFFTTIELSTHRNVGVALNKPDTAREEKKLIQGIQNIITKEYKTTRFWFYSMDTHPTYPSDFDFTNHILDSLDNKIKEQLQYVILPTDRHPTWLFSTFQFLDGFIALRLHGSIFAYRYSLPSVGLTYSEKCSSFIKATGKKPYAMTALSHALFTRILGVKKKRNVSKTSQVVKGIAYAY